MISYTYATDGTKLRALYATGTNNILSPIGVLNTNVDNDIIYSDSTVYCDNSIYVNGKLDKILLPDGYVQVTYRTIRGRLVAFYDYYYTIKDHQGSARINIAEEYLDNRPSEGCRKALSYYPFGKAMNNWISWVVPFKDPYTYTGKKEETMHSLGWYDYGKRFYDPNYRLSFVSIDPLCEKYYSISPYVYCANNPINMVDADGLYPRSILVYDANLGLYGGYKFTKSAVHLLALVSGVSRLYINNTVIQKRAVGQYRPWYSANKGGGAITLGTGLFNSNITYTENFFNDDPNSYNGNGFGQDVMAWLSLSSHEVGHLPQIGKAGGLLSYLVGFAIEYVKSGHDAAASEIEADKGYKVFNEFNSFVNKTYGYGSMEKLFNSSIRENDKIDIITEWWNDYQNVQKQQTESFLNDFQNLEQGVYEWNGDTWERRN